MMSELYYTTAASLGALPQGKAGAMIVDPGWHFATRSPKGRGKCPKYRCDLTLAEICALPVGELAAPNSALFLWIPWPFIFDAKPVMESWGFAYSGLAWEWLKYNPVTGKFAFGNGYGTRKNCEPCLLGLRGRPVRKSRSERDFILAPRRAHSQKPDEQYGKVERLYDGPYLELFARQKWPGWTSWGDELPAENLESVPMTARHGLPHREGPAA
jgi:N6-adenosine-specific RNA methylase IME4